MNRENNNNQKVYKIYINGEAVIVKKDVYQEYWKSVEHERYVEKRDSDLPSLDDVLQGCSHSYVECRYLQHSNPTKEAFDKKQLKEYLHHALSKLSNQEHLLLHQIFFLEMNEGEIAEHWKVQQGTISKRKQKALKRLQKWMKDKHDYLI